MINVQESRERFKAATKNMDYDRAVVLGGIFGELMHEVERLKQENLSDLYLLNGLRSITN